jgi:uncharacterized membrane protein
MRDFFIKSLDKLVGIVIVLMAVAVVVAAIGATMGGATMNGQHMGGGPLAGLLILVIGAIYILFVGGFMYLGLGIYHNTKRTAEALEKQFGR